MDPDDFASLELWLKGDAGVFEDDAATDPAENGDGVAVWQDQSGNGNHATQTTGANRPTLDTTGVNGIPAIDFDAPSQHHLFLPNFLTGFTTAAEIFAVLKCDNDPPATNTRAGLWTMGGDGVNHDLYPFTDANVYLGWGSTVRKAIGNPVRRLNEWHLLRIFSKPSLWNVKHMAGSDIASTGVNTMGWSAAPKLGYSLTSNIAFDGKIAELFLFSAELTDFERGHLLEYVRSRFGLWTFDTVVPQAVPITHSVQASVGGAGTTGTAFAG